jgi:hypothetical protein
MAVHTFFTGVRGVVAPVAAFYLATRLPLPVMGWMSAGIIVVGTLFLIPEIKIGKSARPAANPLVEDIPE